MYGDTTAIRRLATRLRETATDLREEGAQSSDRAAQVPWQGLAAEAMRATVGARVGELGHTADLHDAAADALDLHAGCVDEAKAAIAAAEDAVTGAVTDAAAGLVSAAASGLSALADLPPSGHRAWLDLLP
jgi:hypothetical protein